MGAAGAAFAFAFAFVFAFVFAFAFAFPGAAFVAGSKSEKGFGRPTAPTGTGKLANGCSA